MGTTRVAVCNFPFERLLCKSGVLPAWVRCGVVLLLLALAAATVVGVAVLPAFTITWQGLVATLLPADAVSVSSSLLSLGLQLPQAAGTYAGSSGVAVRLLQLLLIGTLLVAPLLWLLLLTLLWAAPLSVAAQRRLLRAAERCFAWAGLDVFVLTILAGLAQLTQYAKFMLGDECDGINRLLAAHFADLVPGEPSCLAVAPQLRAGIFVLLPTVLVSAALGFFVMHAAACAVEARAGDGSAGKLRKASLASALLSEEAMAEAVVDASLASARINAASADAPGGSSSSHVDERLARARAAQYAARDVPLPEGRPTMRSSELAI